MKEIHKISTAEDLQRWAKYFSVVPPQALELDSKLNLGKAVVTRRLHINPDTKEVVINVVVFIVDGDGNPINGRVNPSEKNVIPAEIDIIGNNSSIVDITNFQVVKNQETLNNMIAYDPDNLVEGANFLPEEICETMDSFSELPSGVMYLPEFEAYRILGMSSPIVLRELIANAVIQSEKI